MSNRISFDSYTEEREDSSTFPAPPDHPQKGAPIADDVLSERVKTAEAEGRWGDSLALKLTHPRPVRDDSSEDPSGNDDGGDGKPSEEWGVAQWDDKSGFFDPPPSQVVNDSNDVGQDDQDDNANDDSNDGEDDQ